MPDKSGALKIGSIKYEQKTIRHIPPTCMVFTSQRHRRRCRFFKGLRNQPGFDFQLQLGRHFGPLFYGKVRYFFGMKLLDMLSILSIIPAQLLLFASNEHRLSPRSLQLSEFFMNTLNNKFG